MVSLPTFSIEIIFTKQRDYVQQQERKGYIGGLNSPLTVFRHDCDLDRSAFMWLNRDQMLSN